MIALLTRPERRCAPATTWGVPPATTTVWTFVWDATDSATSYVLQVCSGFPMGEPYEYNADVGNVLTYDLSLDSGGYYWRVVPMIGAAPGDPTVAQAVEVP